jgi:hypothetical protein
VAEERWTTALQIAESVRAAAQLATPHSVTTLSTVFLIVVTTSPAARVGMILEI